MPMHFLKELLASSASLGFPVLLHGPDCRDIGRGTSLGSSVCVSLETQLRFPGTSLEATK